MTKQFRNFLKMGKQYTKKLKKNQNPDETGEKKKAEKFVNSGKFLGRESELESKVFTVGSGTRSDQFIETTKEVALYCGCVYKEDVDIKVSIESLETYALIEPVAPVATTNSKGDVVQPTVIDIYINGNKITRHEKRELIC